MNMKSEAEQKLYNKTFTENFVEKLVVLKRLQLKLYFFFLYLQMIIQVNN